MKNMVLQLQTTWDVRLPQSPEIPKVYATVPKRLYVTPVNKPDDYCGLNAKNKEAYIHYVKTARSKLTGAHRLEALIQFQVNGVDSVWEIARKVRLQSASCDVEHVLAYLKMLETFGLIAFA